MLPLPVRRRLRRLRRRAFGSSLQVVFHERYTAAVPGVPHDALRAEHILAFLAAEGLVLRSSVERPKPVSLRALERVHAADYLDSVHEPEVLTSIFGIDVGRAQVDRLLDEQRLHTGGTLAALELSRHGGLAVNLGGGLHHAHADHGAGFCIFNDIAVAIARERSRRYRGRVLVVDLDLHDGDGTRDFFRHDSSVHTFSIHARHWGDVEAVESTSLELGERVDDQTYLEALREHLPPVVKRFRPRLVIYLAGCDPAHNDQLGDWCLSAAGLLERDRLVVEQARRRSSGLCVLLAGGYGPESWRYSARFLGELESGRRLEPPPTETMTLARYRHIASLFSASELSGGGSGDDFGLTEADLMLPGWSGLHETRFLGFYTKHALELVLERSGSLDRLRDLGFDLPTLELQLDDPAGHALRIYGDADRTELLVELRLRRDRRALPGMELLSVEWLLMQNPRLTFSETRQRLPGQEHPGLGMLADLVAMLILVCDRLHLDGLTFTPSQFHIAAYGRSHLRFLDAETQGRFESMLDFFEETGTPLATATRAIAEGRLVDVETGEVVRWRPEPMVLAVSENLQQRLDKAQVDQGARLRLRLEPASPG